MQSERANLVRDLACSDPSVRREMFMSISLVLGGSRGSDRTDHLPDASDWKAFTRGCVTVRAGTKKVLDLKQV